MGRANKLSTSTTPFSSRRTQRRRRVWCPLHEQLVRPRRIYKQLKLEGGRATAYICPRGGHIFAWTKRPKETA